MTGKEYHLTSSNYCDQSWLVNEDPQAPQDPFKEDGMQMKTGKDTADQEGEKFFCYFILHIGSSELLLIHCVRCFSVSLTCDHSQNFNLLRPEKKMGC